VAPSAMSCRPLSRAISASSPAFKTAALRRRPVNYCALASKVLSMSSVGMCMTVAPGGERDKSARGLANCPVIAAALPRSRCPPATTASSGTNRCGRATFSATPPARG
jgi:hypothetical protein